MIFSLVVPTIHRTTELDRLLSSLAAQKTDGWDLLRDLEVLVVDQNPDDRLEKIMMPYRNRLTLVHLKAPPLGQSHAKNIGLEQVRGRYVGFPDDDCYFAEDTLGRVLEAFGEGPESFGLFGRGFDPETKKFLLQYPSEPRIIRRPKNPDAFLGLQIAQFYPVPLAQKVGGFDADLCSGGKWGSGEETDFALRFLALGHDIRYVPAIIVHHPLVVAGTMELEKVRKYARGFGALCRKQGMGMHWAWKVLKQALGAALFLLVLKFRQAKTAWAIVAGRWDGFWAYGASGKKAAR